MPRHFRGLLTRSRPAWTNDPTCGPLDDDEQDDEDGMDDEGTLGGSEV